MKKNVLDKKQFGFLQEYFTDYAIIQLIEQINIFENSFTLGVFIDLSKVFDIVEY